MRPLLFCLVGMLLLFSLQIIAQDALEVKNNDQRADSLLKLAEHCFEKYGRGSDSLRYYAAKTWEVAEHSDDEILKANVQFYRSFSFFPTDTARVFQLLRNCLEIYLQFDLPFEIGKTHYTLGHYQGKLGYFPIKKNHLTTAIEYLSSSAGSLHSFYWFNAHIALSSVNQQMGNFSEALEAAQRSKKIARLLNNEEYLMRAVINLSAVYGDLSIKELNYGTEYDRSRFKESAKENLLEAYRLAKKLDIADRLCLTSYNLGLFYSEEKAFSISNQYLDESIAVGIVHGFHDNVFSALEIKGDNLYEAGRLLESEECRKQAYYYGQQSRSTDVRIKAEYLQAQIFADRKEYHKAIIQAKAGLSMALKMNNRRRIQGGYDYLYEWSKVLGNNNEALNYLEKWIAIKDKIVSDEAIQTLQRLKNKHEAAEREAQILLLQKNQTIQQLHHRQQMSWITGIFIFLILVSGVLFLNNRNQILNKKRLAVELEQRLLRSQMNPHFTFNTLSSIQNFLLQNQQGKEAAYYLAKFAKLMRQILDQSSKAFITLQEEIQTLENYLKLQQLRYSKSFDFQINIDPNIDQTTTSIPPMLIQPILENAIEHGKIYAIPKGAVHLDFKLSGSLLAISVTDNGMGKRANTERKAAKHKSVALNIIKDRVRFLQKTYSKKINFRFEYHPNGGAEVSFNFPFLPYPTVE